jgi:hypothetical protein
VAGNPGIEPALDLLGKVKNLDRHGEILCKSAGPRSIGRGPKVTPRNSVNGDIIAYLADRFQYLSVNIP